MNTDNTALVLEGGGLRGVFTCGVLDCFMKATISRRGCLPMDIYSDEDDEAALFSF